MMERIEGRFWSKVDKHGPNGCWLWTASTQRGRNFYGYFWNGQRVVRAHRFSYIIAKGEIPRGLELDHLCKVQPCVNPDHLEAVTRKENILRGNGAPARHARKTTCPRGHPYNYVRGGDRRCRECDVRIKSIYKKAFRARERMERLVRAPAAGSGGKV